MGLLVWLGQTKDEVKKDGKGGEEEGRRMSSGDFEMLASACAVTAHIYIYIL
jgi:hypothetical protein